MNAFASLHMLGCSLIGLVCGGAQTIEELVSQVCCYSQASPTYIPPHTSINIHSSRQEHEGARYTAACRSMRALDI